MESKVPGSICVSQFIASYNAKSDPRTPIPLAAEKHVYIDIIRLHLLDNKRHNLPHTHARYDEFEISIGIEEGEILTGVLPREQLRLVQAWIELHRDEVPADWDLAASGENPYKIDPL